MRGKAVAHHGRGGITCSATREAVGELFVDTEARLLDPDANENARERSCPRRSRISAICWCNACRAHMRAYRGADGWFSSPSGPPATSASKRASISAAIAPQPRSSKSGLGSYKAASELVFFWYILTLVAAPTAQPCLPE